MLGASGAPDLSSKSMEKQIFSWMKISAGPSKTHEIRLKNMKE